MKIIGTDNFNRDNISEFILEEDLTEEEAKKKCEELNSKERVDSQTFYVVKPDDYDIYKWEP